MTIRRGKELESNKARSMSRSGAGSRQRFVAVFQKEGLERSVSALANSAGLKQVARAHEFGTAAATLGTAKGADMVVLDAIGAALIELEPDQVESMLTAAEREGSILSLRPPRLFRAIANEFRGNDIQTRNPRDMASLLRGTRGGGNTLSTEYLLGIQDAIGLLVEQLLHGGRGAPEVERLHQPLPRESTWGLKATRVELSPFSGRGVKVAILDTGLDLTHPDFRGRTIITESFVQGQSVQDGNGHGTHCAGTACGPRVPKGNVPRYGVACEADIYVGKVLSNAGTGDDEGVMAGMDWAVRNGCDIISMSLGAPAVEDEEYDEVYESIARTALESGSLVIAAAGNDSHRPYRLAPVGSPANCPSVMAVAALDEQLRVADFSCAGDINLAAPGVGILSTVPVNQQSYDTFDGTSMATPHVAGIAALLCEKTGLKGRKLWEALLQEARSLPSPRTDVGVGLVQAPR